jgi:hypothetical protein
MQKLPITTLDMRITTKTLYLLFPNEMAFVVKNAYRFLAHKPEVVTCIDQDRMSVAMLLGITEQMEQQSVADEIARKQAADEAEWAAKVADSKVKQQLADPASLTSGYVRQ